MVNWKGRLHHLWTVHAAPHSMLSRRIIHTYTRVFYHHTSFSSTAFLRGWVCMCACVRICARTGAHTSPVARLLPLSHSRSFARPSWLASSCTFYSCAGSVCVCPFSDQKYLPLRFLACLLACLLGWLVG